MINLKTLIPLKFLSKYSTLLIYLVFVWFIAFLRKDYLWIDHDDPNLLSQSILISKGFIPNLDFFSGYPGLSIQIQAVIIKIIDASPFSEHIYSALQASILGLVLLWFRSNIQPWIIVLFLFFIYSQGMLINPTPNPGYLFDVAFIIGLKKAIDFFNGMKLLDVFIAGIFFGISFLFKQYGIFGPICFYLASVALLNSGTKLKNTIYIFSMLFIHLGIIYKYFFGGLLPNIEANYWGVIENTILFIIPCFAALFANLTLTGSQSPSKQLSLKLAFKANLILVGTFIGLIFLYFTIVYGYSNIPDVMKELFFFAPRYINEDFVKVLFSKNHILRSVFGLIILFSPLILSYVGNSKYLFFFLGGGLISVFFLFFRISNLSATPFLPIFFISLIFVSTFILKSNFKRILLAILSGISPFFLILIPYPKFSYHIPILVFLLIIFLSHHKNYLNSYSKKIIFKRDFFYICLISFIPILFLLKTSDHLKKINLYTFRNFSFKSDVNWQMSIQEAYKVQSGNGHCSTYACRYLLLREHSFTDYSKVINKPLFQL
jgi:hypothetical protein